jgi:hypothetical protein
MGRPQLNGALYLNIFLRLAQFVNQEFSRHGSAGPIVARTTRQTRDLIGAFPLPEQVRQNLVETAFSVQARLLACHETVESLDREVREALRRIGTNGMLSEQGGRFVTIPGVPDSWKVGSECTSC